MGQNLSRFDRQVRRLKHHAKRCAYRGVDDLHKAPAGKVMINARSAAAYCTRGGDRPKAAKIARPAGRREADNSDTNEWPWNDTDLDVDCVDDPNITLLTLLPGSEPSRAELCCDCTAAPAAQASRCDASERSCSVGTSCNSRRPRQSACANMATANRQQELAYTRVVRATWKVIASELECYGEMFMSR